MTRTTLLVCWILAGWFATAARASELKSETVVAFDRYIRATENRMAHDLQRDRFLAFDRLPDAHRLKAYDRVQNGELYIEQLRTLEDEHPIDIPGGLIHHWVAVIFVPGVTLSEALAVLRDYDNQQNIYKPDVHRSRLLEQNGNEFKIYLQYYEKYIVTVVLNVDSDVNYAQFGSTRFQSAARSTRVAEVENLDKPNEGELPVGNDHGFLWRFNSYWRVEEKDGGVYLQNESVALTRRVPPILAWLVNPLLKTIPWNILSKLLFGTREALVNAKGHPILSLLARTEWL